MSEYIKHSEGNHCFKKHTAVTHVCTKLPVWGDFFVLFSGFFVYMVKKKRKEKKNLRNTEYTTNNTWIWKQERPG